MYEGGRKGQKRQAEDYEVDDDGESSRDRREKLAKAETAFLIQKQFRLRKGAAAADSEDKEKEESQVLSYAKVKAAEFTANKISGLDVKTREDYLGK